MLRGGISAGEIATLDGMRFIDHVAASRALKSDGIVPSEKVGRVVARLILIDKGLDTMSSAYESDVKRIERVVGQP